MVVGLRFGCQTGPLSGRRHCSWTKYWAAITWFADTFEDGPFMSLCSLYTKSVDLNLGASFFEEKKYVSSSEFLSSLTKQKFLLMVEVWMTLS